MLVDGYIPINEPHYTVDEIAIGCYTNPPDNCGGTDRAVDSYLLKFIPIFDPNDSVTLAMGETKSLYLAGHSTEYYWRVHNLRSYQTEYCDDYWNWAYTMALIMAN